MRLTAAAQRKSPAKFNSVQVSVPSCIGGWNTVDPIAAMPEIDAVQMDNWIPRPGWLEPRRGYRQWATGMGADTPVETLMAYYGTSGTQFFAAADTTLFDVTANGAAVPTTVTTLSSARCQFCNFTNASDDHYLVECNGFDTPKIYNGSAWGDLSITGPTLTQIIQPYSFQGRLFFLENTSTKFWYLPLGAIAGTAASFELGSFMGQGGYIMAMASWTIDTRQTVSDYAAFITSRGQVIVFAGTNPADAAAWQLVGVYNLGPPIGRRCFLKIAGDLALITLDGVVSMNQMLSTDRSAANRTSITNKIMQSVSDAIQLYGDNFGWQLQEYPKGTLAILNVPVQTNQESYQFAMNTLTGAWCRFLGIDANCWGILNDNIFFGGNDGIVYEWDYGSGDDGSMITATVKSAFNYFDSRGRFKRWNMIRPIITTDGSVTPGLGLNTDFSQNAPITTPSLVDDTQANWDEALWDDAVWPIETTVSANWLAIRGTGQCASIITQVTTGDNGTAAGVRLQLNSWDLTMEVGGVI